MGRRGPVPKPTALKILHGENRPSHLNLNEPVPRAAPPVCPDDVTLEVRAVWERVVSELDAMNLARAADTDALRCYCEAVVTHRRASELVGKSALLLRGQKGNLVRNPIIAIQRDAAILVRTFAAEFGLTPSSRSRIEVMRNAGGSDDASSNPFAGIG